MAGGGGGPKIVLQDGPSCHYIAFIGTLKPLLPMSLWSATAAEELFKT